MKDIAAGRFVRGEIIERVKSWSVESKLDLVRKLKLEAVVLRFAEFGGTAYHIQQSERLANAAEAIRAEFNLVDEFKVADKTETKTQKPGEVALHEPDMKPPASQQPAARELPSELDTEQARKYFARAVAAGYMNENYKWLERPCELGYFCYKVYSNPRPITALELFFGVRNLAASITQASNEPKRADLKKWRAKQDKEIFFD